MSDTRARAGAAIALVLAALAVPASADARTAKSFFGVNPQTELSGDDYSRMRAGKVGSLRFPIRWSHVAASPSGGFDWTLYDGVVAAAAQTRLKLLPVLASSPTWVAEAEGHQCSEGQCFRFAPTAKVGLSAWRDFLAAAAARYGPKGDFWAENPQLPRRPIRNWQIWNEMNSPEHYQPRPDPRSYARLLRNADRAIRSVDPRAKVIVGGMFATPFAGDDRGGGIYSWTYLKRLYAKRGVRRHFDGIALHPYPAGSKSESGSWRRQITFQVKLALQAVRKAGERRVPLWITEIGAASSGGGHALNVGPRGQARMVRTVYRIFLANKGRWNVRGVFWYSWRDIPPTVGACLWCPESGLFDQALEPKPAWKAFARLTGGE